MGLAITFFVAFGLLMVGFYGLDMIGKYYESKK